MRRNDLVNAKYFNFSRDFAAFATITTSSGYVDIAMKRNATWMKRTTATVDGRKREEPWRFGVLSRFLQTPEKGGITAMTSPAASA